MRAAWWWIDRWRKSTAYTDMTLAEQGAYRNLLDELWLRDGVIPNDERILAKICGDALEWPKVRVKVLGRFRLTAEGWRNDTHDEVSAWPKAQAEKGRNRAAGATREGGRFTSRAPAEHQPEPPAGDQPPYSVSVLRTPSPLPSPDNERQYVAPTYALPPDVQTETALRNERWRDERSLLAVVGQIAEKTGKEAGEVMEHVTAYKRRDGSRAGGRRNPAQLRSHEAVVKSLDDAKAWLADLDKGATA